MKFSYPQIVLYNTPLNMVECYLWMKLREKKISSLELLHGGIKIAINGMNHAASIVKKIKKRSIKEIVSGLKKTEKKEGRMRENTKALKKTDLVTKSTWSLGIKSEEKNWRDRQHPSNVRLAGEKAGWLLTIVTKQGKFVDGFATLVMLLLEGLPTQYPHFKIS